MSRRNVNIKRYLLPVSWLYGIVVYLRNKFFKWGIFKQNTYDIPIICVGNLAVGGTGKTPHIEHLIRLLKEKYKVAVLSRGYKRKTSGYVLATTESTYKDIGDEPFQMMQKFPHVTFAVSEKRCRGIDKLLALPEKKRPEVILLDDAYQHRYVVPSFSILLTDYSRPYIGDKLLPAGRLRESASHSADADIIIVTKCPIGLKPIGQRILLHELHPYPYQDLLFSSLSYGKLEPLFNTKSQNIELSAIKGRSVLVVTGIASPRQLLDKLKKITKDITPLTYPDHHNFKKKDVVAINRKFEEMGGTNKMVILTEKDATRLKNMQGFSDKVKNNTYVLPIEVSFINEEDRVLLDDKILKHVRENSRNRKFHKK